MAASKTGNAPKTDNIEQPKQVENKEIKYKCITTCQFAGRLWKEGNIMIAENDNLDVPSHCFVKLG